MNVAFYSGASGLNAFGQAMNTVGNNLANANTEGFKPSCSVFRDLMYTHMYVHSPARPYEGSGERTLDTALLFKPGSLKQTSRALDFAVEGNGLFAVQKNGKTSYTRAGNFQLGLENGKAYLTTEDGAYVLDAAGNRIAVDTDKLNSGEEADRLARTIGIFQFRNPDGLLPSADNCFIPSENSGNPELVANKRPLNGYLEQSAVSVVDEMTQMITAQRGFQLSSRVVQTADQMEEIVNTLRR